ncbi:MAG: DUF349 domain-containing protein [Promicromonosporaceae bacterium]|nr:DUF349 domain-containing protein [Promicromonosporaceae bacterium]
MIQSPQTPAVETPEAAVEPIPVVEPAETTSPAVEPANEAPTAEETPATVDATPEPLEPATDLPVETPETATEPAPAVVEPVEIPEPSPAETAPVATEEPLGAEATPVFDEMLAAVAESPAEAVTPEAEAAPAVAAPGLKPAGLPRPMGRPAVPGKPVAAAPVAPILDPAAVTAAEAFGRVDEEGNVYVLDGDNERLVGQVPGATPSDAMGLYVRRYLDLNAKTALFEARLAGTDLATKEIDQTLSRLTAETTEPAAIGDLAALRERVAAVGAVAAERRKAIEAERAAAKAEALVARTTIVEAAEKIAATDPQRMQWRPAGEELRTLLDSWKDAQRNGPRLNRADEDSLWKRFSAARTSFDRERRHYFSELEEKNSSAKAAKERLVAEAEKLSTSKDWGATAGAYRDLMAKWKDAGRASRKDDDALWTRFRGAQDKFFAAREADNAATDAEFAKNLEIKEKILADAEALLPIKDLAATKAALRSIQDRWEAAGKVPRNDVRRVENRMQAVEQAVRDAEQAQYNRVDPEKRARAEGALSQLEEAIAKLEADLVKATGDKRKVAEIEAAIAARKSWLEQVARAAEESRG